MAARIAIAAALVIAACLPSLTRAQTPAFSYQGQLNDAGSPASGSYDLRFILYTAGAGGSQIGTTLYVDDKIVAAGLFTAELDFGASSLPGADRWLEVAVRPGAVSNADRTPATYTVLNPRQRLTSTPYAVRARDADTIDGFDSSVFLTGVPNPLTLANDLGPPVVTVDNVTGTGVFGASHGNAGVALWGEGHGSLGIGVLGWGRDFYAFSRPAGICGSSATGWGIIGNTNTGVAISAMTLGATGSPRALVATTDAASGKALVATNTHASQNTSAELASRVSGSVLEPALNGAVAAMNASSPGIGIYARSDGNATALYGESETWNAVLGKTQSGSGVLGLATASNGAGVWAYGSGITGTALQIQNGAIKVVNAGIGTSTPVFIHRATPGNINSNYTVIDHPMTNGDPNAILIITPNWNPGGVGGTYNANPFGVYYNNASQRWAIFNQNLATMIIDQAFNVLVVKAGIATEPPTAISPTPSLNRSNAPVDPQLGGIQIELAKSDSK